jgi:hypothetical protein
MDIGDICCCIDRKIITQKSQKNNISTKNEKKRKNYDIYDNEDVRYSKIQFSEDNNSTFLNSKRWELVNTDECIICMKPTIIIGGIITCIDCKDTKIFAHRECADEWIKKNGLCIVCRKNTLLISV